MSPSVYTVGHSNHREDAFLALLVRHGINVLVDVRSIPYSRRVPHFNRPNLEKALRRAGLKYQYLGRELGGRPEGAEFYDADGRVLLDKLAGSRLFMEGIARLVDGIQRYRVAIACAEENPANCHRSRLIAPALRARGVIVVHVRGDGRLEEYWTRETLELQQGTLFSSD